MTSHFLYRKIVVGIIAALLSYSSLSAQAKKSRIEIKQADKVFYKKGLEPKNRLIGNVIFFHDGATMYCDSAWSYADKNFLKAFSNVHISQDDTLHLYGDYLEYNGDTRIAEVIGKVRLRDPSMLLTADKLIFDRTNNTALYRTGGVIINGENTLTSLIGIYYAASKTFLFNKNVVLENPRYDMFSDTLQYFTSTKIAKFEGPTKIISDSSTIYCENGVYNTQIDIAQFKENAVLWNKTKRLSGDSMYYEKQMGFGQVFGRISILDTADKSLIRGDFGEYVEYPESAKVKGEPLYSFFQEDDTLHIHGDAIYFNTDTSGNQILKIYNEVRIYRSDMQGVCDSLTYSSIDSTFRLFNSPALWAEKNQLTGDTVLLEMRNNTLDTIKMIGNAFILSNDTLDQFNQIRGKVMKGKFFKNELKNMHSYGNGQTAYYAREENGTAMGLSRTDCSNILIRFRNNEVTKIAFLIKPDSKLYPPDKIPDEEKTLKGFQERHHQRPTDRKSLFEKTPPL